MVSSPFVSLKVSDRLIFKYEVSVKAAKKPAIPRKSPKKLAVSPRQMMLGAVFVIFLLILSGGNSLHYGRSLLFEYSVTAVGAFYSSAAQLKLFCSNFRATFHAFICESTCSSF